MPLLARARQVQVVTVVDRPNEDIEIGEVEIARHLARHAVNAELKIFRQLTSQTRCSHMQPLAARTFW